MALPYVSILVACRNERASIKVFLDSLVRQVVPGVSLEAVIADALSDDGTRAVLESYAARFPWIHLLDNPGRIAAAGLNLALRQSTGAILVRMDAHTEYAPDYIAQCLAVLDQTGAANVGGPARTKSDGYWQTAIALAFHSAFFSGGSRFHDVNFEGLVDTVPYGCWRRETLEALGGFDEALERNQDDELNFRMVRAGGTIWQSPRIRSWYFPRRSLTALARQYYQYGRWKAVVIRKHGRPAEWRQVVPSLVLALLAGFPLAVLSPPVLGVGLCGLGIYGVASLVASLAALQSRTQLRLLPALPLVFGTVHVTYGIGLLRGLAGSLLSVPHWLQRKGTLPA
jgi:succinoglycan biosynthesis protein ExoA